MSTSDDSTTSPDGAGEDLDADSPYAPPDASMNGEEGARGPSEEMFDETPSVYQTGGVGIGTFLGGPLAGVVLIYLNFRRLGWDRRARNTIWLSAVGLPAFAVFVAMIPLEFGVNLAVMGLMMFIWSRYQTRAVEAYGELESISGWYAAGIGVLAGVVTVVVVFGGAFAYGMIAAMTGAPLP